MSSRVRIYLKSANNPTKVFTTPSAALAELMAMYQKPGLGTGVEWVGVGQLSGRAVKDKKITMGFNGPEAMYLVASFGQTVPSAVQPPNGPLWPPWKRLIWLYEHLNEPWKRGTTLVVTREGRAESYRRSPANPSKFGHSKPKPKKTTAPGGNLWFTATEHALYGSGPEESPLTGVNSFGLGHLTQQVAHQAQAHGVAYTDPEYHPVDSDQGPTPATSTASVGVPKKARYKFQPGHRPRVGIWR